MNRPRHRRIPAANRRGLSLTEVLISTFVAVIGLLSLAALIPLGINELAQANRADYAAATGRIGWREIKIRDWLAPLTDSAVPLWYDWQGQPITPGTFTARYPVSGTNTPVSAFVIDPYALSALNSNKVKWFPSENDGQTVPRLPRITVAASRWHNVPLGRDTNGFNQQAIKIFTLSDDALFSEDVDAELGRRQRIFPTNGGAAAGAPQNKGDYSWFMTVSPAFGDPGVVRKYVASVVVCHKRSDPRNLIGLGGCYPPEEERVAVVSQFYDGGIGGGSVRIQWDANNPAYKLKAGDWVMLYGHHHLGVDLTGAQQVGLIARWYEVIAVDDGSDIVNGFRDITLRGGDWDPRALVGQTTYVAIVNRVVGVYEKSITTD